MPCWSSFISQPGCFATDSISTPWSLIDILTGRSVTLGFPVRASSLDAAPSCIASFRPYRSALLVREFRQQPWFRNLQERRGRSLYWVVPICAVFFLPYYDSRVADPQFYIQEGSVLSRLTDAATPLSGSERREKKMTFLLFIFDAEHPDSGRIPMNVALPRLAF